MARPRSTKDRTIYHTILSDLHRMQATLLNMQVLDEPTTAAALREHFTRQQSITLGKLTEWRQRRPEIYRQAQEDFQQQIHQLEDAGEGPDV